MAFTKKQWNDAQGYYEAGLSLSKITEKTGISKAAVSKKAKTEQWVHGENTDYIEAKEIIAVKKSTKSEHLLNIADEIADEKIHHMRLINDNATMLAGKITTMAQQIDTPNDLKTLAEANDKLAITLKVADRHAPKIDITQQQAITPSVNYYAPEKDRDL